MINKSLKFIDFVWFSHRNHFPHRELQTVRGRWTWKQFASFCFVWDVFLTFFLISLIFLLLWWWNILIFMGSFFFLLLWKHSFWCFTVKPKIFIGKFVHTSDRLGPKQQPLKLAGLTNNSNRHPEQKLFNYLWHPCVSMFRKIQVVKIKIWSIRSR